MLPKSFTSKLVFDRKISILILNIVSLLSIPKPRKCGGSGPGGGVHLTRFWSGTCHRGFKNIPIPYTNFLKKYTRPYTNFSKKYIRLIYFMQKS